MLQTTIKALESLKSPNLSKTVKARIFTQLLIDDAEFKAQMVKRSEAVLAKALDAGEKAIKEIEASRKNEIANICAINRAADEALVRSLGFEVK